MLDAHRQSANTDSVGIRLLLGLVLRALPALVGVLGAVSPARAGGLPIPPPSELFSLEQGLGPPGTSSGIVAPQFPQLIFDGALYWVLYQSAIELPPHGGSLLAVRVDESGTVLDSYGLFIAPYADALYHSITPAPWGALVTYASDGAVLTVRLGRDGTIADRPPQLLAAGASVYPYPGVACRNEGCLAIWSSQSETHAVVLDGCGAPLPQTEFQLPYGEWEPRAAGDGYLVVGGTLNSSNTLPVRALGLSAEGRARWGPLVLPIPRGSWNAFAARASEALFVWLDSAGVLWSLALDVATGQSGTPQRLPLSGVSNIGGLSAEGDHFRLALHLAASDAVLRLDASGLPLDSEPLTVTTDGACPAGPARIASGSRTALVFWQRDQSTPACLEAPPSAALVGFESSPTVTQLDVTGAVARMGAPALASDGKRYLAAWFEERAGAPGLYTQALDLTGLALEAPLLTIPAPLQRNDLRPATVSFLSDRYVVELEKNTDTVDGNRAAEIDAATLARSAPREQAKLGVPGRTSFLHVGLDITQSGEDEATLTRIRAQVTDRTSTVIGSSWTRELPYGGSERNPVVGFDGQNFAVVWKYETQDASPGAPEPELLFMRFDERGAPLLDEPLVLPGLGAYAPQALTFGATLFLLTLAADIPDLGQPLSAIALTPSGKLWDNAPHPLSAPAPGEQLQFRAAIFDGNAFEVAWSQSFFPSSNGAPVTARTDSDLHVAWLAADGSNIAETAVANSREDERTASLASARDAHALLAYNRFDRDPHYLSTRAFVRRLGSGSCSSDQGCADSSCSDCCPAGCAPPGASLTCSIATCDATCAEHEHCVASLGCVADPPSPTPNPQLARGCGCRYPIAEADANAASFALLVSVALVSLRGLRRRRCGHPGHS